MELCRIFLSGSVCHLFHDYVIIVRLLCWYYNDFEFTEANEFERNLFRPIPATTAPVDAIPWEVIRWPLGRSLFQFRCVQQISACPAGIKPSTSGFPSHNHSTSSIFIYMLLLAKWQKSAKAGKLPKIKNFFRNSGERYKNTFWLTESTCMKPCEILRGISSLKFSASYVPTCFKKIFI
jgi:hypothetical protein